MACRRRAMHRRRDWPGSGGRIWKINFAGLSSTSATIRFPSCTCGTLRRTSVRKGRTFWRTISRAFVRGQPTMAIRRSPRRERRYSKRACQAPTLSPALLAMARRPRASGKYRAWEGWRIRICREDYNSGTSDTTITLAIRCLTSPVDFLLNKSLRWHRISASSRTSRWRETGVKTLVMI